MQCNCNSLFTSFPSHQVSIWTRVHSFFSALSMHYPQCKALAVRKRNCRLLYHGYNAVTDESWRKCRLLDHGYNAVAMTLGPAAMLCPGFCTGSWQKRSKRVKYCGSIRTLRPPPDEGETCAKFDSDRFRNVDLYKVQTKTNKKPFFLYILYIYIYSCQQYKTVECCYGNARMDSLCTVEEVQSNSYCCR